MDASTELEYRPSFKPGSLAEREHRKWTEKAIVMANNPYSRYEYFDMQGCVILTDTSS